MAELQTRFLEITQWSLVMILLKAVSYDCFREHLESNPCLTRFVRLLDFAISYSYSFSKNKYIFKCIMTYRRISKNVQAHPGDAGLLTAWSTASAAPKTRFMPSIITISLKKVFVFSMT